MALYVLPTALHGNPPIDDAEATLRYVADRGLWTLAHFANIAAVVLWAVAVATLVPSLPVSRALAGATVMVFGIAAATFAVYFSLHALGLSTAADQYLNGDTDPVAVLERAETLLLVLGSTAFVAQGLLGSAIAVFAVLLARIPEVNKPFAFTGVLAGTGWLVGALTIDFAVIVPCTIVVWLWLLILGGFLLRSRLPGSSRQPDSAGS
ncbi:hypothetical protein ALI144C_04420 [Actinosynnema sp. ALI-1.44]|nr:hypothetical protein ALI144C_04420 [Actinosynnema sp. ALI-1.44]